MRVGSAVRKTEVTMDVTLVVKKGSNETKVIRLRSEETVIGRQNGCELRIPSAAVSRRHCRLSFRDDILSVEDLDSANGTLVNGERIEGIHILRPGDSLEVGPLVFVVKYQLTAAAADRLASEATVDAQKFEFVDEAQEDDVQALDIEEVTEIDEESSPAKKGKKTKPKSREEDSDTQPELAKTDSNAAAKKKPKKPVKKSPPQESLDPDVAAMMDGEASWHMPAGDDFRDFLNQMEDT